jgi:chemosensory pili system protein ChpA (sensor histidine kinase/response regulator)
MDRFSLDDVGEQFRTDMAGVLDAIGGGLAAIGPVDCAAAARVEELRRRLGGITDGCHTISGSSSLVAAVALDAGARQLRRLAEEARLALDQMAAAAERFRLLGESAVAGVGDLRAILDLEMARDRGGADALSARLATRAVRALSGEEPTPAPVATGAALEIAGGSEGFAFSDEPAASAPGAEPQAGDFAFAPDEVPAAAPAAAPVASQRAAPDLDPAIVEAFAQEAAELLDGMDANALALDQGSAPAPIVRELFRAYHTLKGSANTVGLTRLGALAHRMEDALDAPAAVGRGRELGGLLLRMQGAMRSTLASGAVPPEAVAIEADIARMVAGAGPSVAADPAAAAPEEAVAGDGQRFLRVPTRHLDSLMDLAGELLISRSRLDARVAGLAAMQSDLLASRARLLGTVDGFRERNEFAGLDGRRLAVGAGVGPGGDGRFSDLELDRYDEVHILSRSLGEISNDIGELQGQIQRTIGELGEDADAFGRVVDGIQGEITRARMVPVGQLFTRLQLVARDAAAHAAKGVRMEVSGGDVALDKTIVDGIYAPMMHLVRNAVAHGIEEDELRAAAGKPVDGTITLSARHEGGQMVIEIADDGGGLDLAALHRRGVAMGAIAADAPLDSDAVRQLVFQPGLSTSATTDEVSGRGMGCDAARREVQRLNGALRVGSRPGGGTTFTIVVPLTLAISRALLVRERGARYAVPMNFVERILDLGQSACVTSAGITRIAYRDAQLPLLALSTILSGAAPARGLDGPGLVLRLGDQRWVLLVESVARQDDIVVSGLGDLLGGHPLFSGVTVSGDGGLVPILDVPGLLADESTRLLAPSPVMAVVDAVPARAAHDGAGRVLFVDDSLSVRKVAELHLRALGVEAVLAVDGADALARLRQESFAMVFTDLEMPRLNGFDLLRELRFIPAWRELPVVVVTSRSADKHRQLAENLGANGYLVKPFTREGLGAFIERWVHRP